MEQETQSIYAVSAHHGLWAGVYFSVLFLLQAATSVLSLKLLGDLMMLAVPFLAYRLMASRYRQCGCRLSFADVWLHGILTFIFGSMIMAVVIYVYVRFFNPSLLIQQMNAAVEAYRAMDMSQMADYLQTFIDSKGLPTARQFALLMIWVVTFTGSILSLLEAAIIKIFIRK